MDSIEGATGEFTESRHSPDEDHSDLPTLATTPHPPPLRHVLEDNCHRDGCHIPASGPREYAPNTDRANQIGAQQRKPNLDSAYSGRTSASANTRYYVLDTESSAPHSRKTILWSIDPEHLIYNIWLIESFIKFIQSFYPPPARIGKYTLNFIVMDSEFPNENSLQMLPREFVSYLVKEPYNPTVEFQGKYGHVLTLPTLNMGSGRMGKRLRVVYMIEYDPPAFEGPQTPQYGLRPYENEVPAVSRAPVQFHHPQHLQELDRSRAVHSCPVNKNHKYMAVITVHILLTEDRLEKRVLRPPFDIDIEEQGNFSELYTKVEALISDAYSVSPQGKLSEIVGSRAVDVHLAYNTFVLPRHFAWNEKSFTEFDSHEKGGTWKLHLVAWIVEHPLGDPEGAPTGLPLPRVTIDRLGNGWAAPAPLDLREWKAGGDDASGFQGFRKAKGPDRRLRPSSPPQGNGYSALISSEPGSHTTPHETYQAWPGFSREPSLPPRPVEIGDPIDGRPWQSTNWGRGQEMKPSWCHKPKTRAPSWQAYTEEHREDEVERRRAESYREDFYAPVRNHGPRHGTVKYYRWPDHGPVAEHGPGEVWKHYGVAGEHKPQTEYWRPESAGSVTSDHSGSQGHSSRGVSEHRPAEGLHMGQSGGGLDHAGGHPGVQAYNVNFTAQHGHDTDQLEARSSPVKRKREE
ncbi:hypothetical protein BGX38DRAFT_1270194 [Terfezia claveryi]|nr:hypothetical protein BGX38DRAFT_1270194 [Terfezia claveryi]